MNTHLHIVVPQNQPGESGRTVLFVSELPDNVNETDLETFFQNYRDNIYLIQIHRIGKALESIAPKNFTATVIFKDHKKADDARKALNLKKIRGKTIRIMWHEKDNSIRYNTQGNLFVKNVAFHVTPREFYEKFLQFGDIISAKLCEDEDGSINGYGYVSYYNPESADNAIRALNDKVVWGDQKLEVLRFQKKNERFQSLTVNKNLYVKNLPESFDEKELRDLFSSYGPISWSKVMVDASGRRSAIVSYEQEESVNKARDSLNRQVVDNTELYVEPLMKKSDRKKLLSSKIIDTNYKLNSQFRECNLHIRNLPQDVDENYLNEVFSQFGEIKSVKIPKMILVTKVKNEFKEYPMSKSFGYVCFTDVESAKKAKEEMNGKFIPKFETAKRPLLIDFFMPINERKIMLNRIQQQYPGSKQFPTMNPYGRPMGMPFNLHPKLAKHVTQPAFPYPQQGPYTQQLPKQVHPQFPQQVAENNRTDDQPDTKYLQSLEDDAAKKDYLGEFIFKKIENHPFAQAQSFTLDTIGKITGMILGIDNVNEIIEIAHSTENLSARISEALNLLSHGNA